eukprot:COSAG05_NODE_1479_length_4770_cov_4.525583_2_plen_103_part_00
MGPFRVGKGGGTITLPSERARGRAGPEVAGIDADSCAPIPQDTLPMCAPEGARSYGKAVRRPPGTQMILVLTVHIRLYRGGANSEFCFWLVRFHCLKKRKNA